MDWSLQKLRQLSGLHLSPETMRKDSTQSDGEETRVIREAAQRMLCFNEI